MDCSFHAFESCNFMFCIGTALKIFAVIAIQCMLNMRESMLHMPLWVCESYLFSLDEDKYKIFLAAVQFTYVAFDQFFH